MVLLVSEGVSSSFGISSEIDGMETLLLDRVLLIMDMSFWVSGFLDCWIAGSSGLWIFGSLGL